MAPGTATTPRPSSGASLPGPVITSGRYVIGAFAHVGRLALFVADASRGLVEVRIWWPRMVTEAVRIGTGSLFIVMFIAAFAGAVTAMQTGYQYNPAMPLYFVGTIVVSMILLELGPVLTALILAGRIGARYAAELGTMRITEQIDALESLGRSPASHLVVPRVIAGMIMIPVLTVFANLTGIAAGWISVKAVLPVSDADFIYGAQHFYRPLDGYYSIIKSLCFAAAITIIPCYMGFNTRQGAEGVGRATTTAVVASSVLILLLDVFVAQLLLGN